MRVAVLGTGTMGAGMARTLKREGHDVTVWNRTRSRAEPLADDGITVATSIGDAVAGAEVVQTILFDRDAVLAVADEITGALAPDAVWVQSATVGPAGIAAIAAAADTDRILDAPVVGTKQPAEHGKLVTLVSGDAGLIDRAQPVFDAIGTKTVRVGDAIGPASALKLACNAWIAGITAAAAQSLALSAALGVDGSLFLQTIEGGAADSPYLQLKGKLMLAGDYPPAFALDGLRKDIDLMLDAAGGTQFTADLLRATADVYAKASEAGHGSEDISAVRAAF